MTQKKQTKRKNKQTSVSVKERIFETDSSYFLKLVVFILLGTFWLKFGQPIIIAGLSLQAIPVGMLVGLLLIRQFEKYQADRKIWYAILLVVTIICYFVPAGVLI